MDAQRLKENFAHVAQHGDEVALFFYSDMFVRNPHLRDMFPVGMGGQRDKLLTALGQIVSQVDDLPNLVPFLQQLGRDHRKFSVVAGHYPEVGASLVTTLRYFSGPTWSAELGDDWTTAYNLVAKVMVEAADDEERQFPAWWNAQVIAHERRRYDIGLIRVAPDQPLPFSAGQSVAVESRSRPRAWRYLSMANAPRPDGTLDFHVKIVDGGAVSQHLVRDLQVGDWLRLGAPIGTLTLNEASRRDLLLVAGGTGLAPLKALLERLEQAAAPPRVTLFHGAVDPDGLYDIEDLSKRAARLPWLTFVPVVSAEQPVQDGSWTAFRDGPAGTQRGLLPDVVARSGNWAGHDAYVCGSPDMVAATADRLARLGLAPAQIKVESFAMGPSAGVRGDR